MGVGMAQSIGACRLRNVAVGTQSRRFSSVRQRSQSTVVQCTATTAGPSEPSDAEPDFKPVALKAKRPSTGVEAQDAEQAESFKRVRLITFASLWIGYASFYITRNCLNFVNPVMLQDPSLGLNLTIIGGITSLLPVAYAFSKGISGFLGSTMSPRLLLSCGLASTGLACLAFGFGSNPTWFAFFWAMNGLLQGLGAPACAKLLTQWYSSSERGTAWSIWTASNNVGGFAAPWIAGTAAGMLGWRWGMWIPGFVALSIASIIVFTITDKPQDRGFKAVEVVKNKNQTNGKKESAKGPSVKEILVQDVLSNPWVWLFAFAYFFTYAIRQGTSSWFVHYLMNVKGITDLPAAAAQVSGLEIGGFFGAISAGTISDVFVRRAKKAGAKTGLVGLRARVVLAYGIFTGLALIAFSVCPNLPLVQWCSIAAVGFGLYGPQMLIGLCGAELVRPDAVGAAQGLLGWVSYMGAACAGAPLALAVQKYGWNIYFTMMIVAAAILCVLILPMLNLKSYAQRMAEEPSLDVADGSLDVADKS